MIQKKTLLATMSKQGPTEEPSSEIMKTMHRAYQADWLDRDFTVARAAKYVMSI